MSNLQRNPQMISCAADEPLGATRHVAGAIPVEVIESRDVPLGGLRAMKVRRTLPHRKRSLIGAWCFLDHYGPDDVEVSGGMDVAPHPHTGLQTVSWLFQGEIEHVDSGGNHGIVRPGEVNLMTSGAGIAHSETSTTNTSVLHGVQLWLALPSAARATAPRRFEHFSPALSEFAWGSAFVFLGSLLGKSSPVQTFTPILGAELRLQPQTKVVVEVNPAFEHGLLIDSGEVYLEQTLVPRNALGYVGIGAPTLDIHNVGDVPARLLLIGGEPFSENIVMWWNFVGRDSGEIRRFREEWEAHSDRFGEVEGYVGHGGPRHNASGMSRIPAPRFPSVTLKPRKNPPPHAQV